MTAMVDINAIIVEVTNTLELKEMYTPSQWAAVLANQVADMAVLAEREACAKIAARMFIRDTENYPAVIAEEIRNRSKY
jgi:hypothetical protein